MSEFLEDNNYLPIELILDIFYKKGGLLHPNSKIFKNKLNIFVSLAKIR